MPGKMPLAGVRSEPCQRRRWTDGTQFAVTHGMQPGDPMDLRRSRRSIRMPAGPQASFSEPRGSAPAGWTGARMLFGRHRFRAPPRLPGDGAAPGTPLHGVRKRHPPLVSLLFGAVLLLWLLLFVFGYG
jgi:hypothetical protein